MTVMYIEYPKLGNEDLIKKYKDKGYEVRTLEWFKDKGSKRCYYKPYKLSAGESIAFDLSELNSVTIKKIEYYLYLNSPNSNKTISFDRKTGKQIIKKGFTSRKKHKIFIRYGAKTYQLTDLSEWKNTHQSEDDVNRIVTDKHKILEDYERQVKSEKEHRLLDKAKEQYELIVSQFKSIPNDIELDLFLDTYAKRYGIYVPRDDRTERLRDYLQIKFYIEHNIEPDYEPDEDVELSIGDATMLDDFIYKYRLQTED